MTDLLDVLAHDAGDAVASGYYSVRDNLPEEKLRRTSLAGAISRLRMNPVIAEAKRSSPSSQTVRADFDAVEVASAMGRGGAVGISILTEPKHFKGSLREFILVRRRSTTPLLMKDFILSPAQLDAAYNIGADAVLLIQAIFDRGYCQWSVDDMVEYAHSYGLEVLLEAHTAVEFHRALASEADLVGINNRDLGTMKVDLDTTRRILSEKLSPDRIVVSESGINSLADIRALKKAGAKAFLVGTAIMSATDIARKVKELVEA